jgi:hypothetical protein
MAAGGDRHLVASVEEVEPYQASVGRHILGAEDRNSDEGEEEDKHRAALAMTAAEDMDALLLDPDTGLDGQGLVEDMDCARPS